MSAHIYTQLLFQSLGMSESDLNTYRLQLQQVEAALTTDPDNEVGIEDTSISTMPINGHMTTNSTMATMATISTEASISTMSSITTKSTMSTLSSGDSLPSPPSNSRLQELVQLKGDLEQVLNLTQDLIASQLEAASSSGAQASTILLWGQS